MSSASVSFPGSRVTLDAQVLEVTIIQEEYKHDIAMFRLPTAGAGRPYFRAGTPVQIDWSRDRDSASFQGFVHHVEQASEAKDTVVWCRGASQRFDNGLRASYRYRTFPSVAGEIARQLNFDVDAVGHGQMWDSLTASGGRSWDFLVRYAKEIGYSLYAKNTRLLLHPRMHVVDANTRNAPVLYLGVKSQGERGSLFDFHPLDGVAPAGEQRHNNVLTGTDRRTGYPFSVTGGVAVGKLGSKQYGAVGETYHDLNVSTPEEARWKAQGLAEMARFNMRATALGEGSPRIHQTWPVLLSGVNAQYEGTWFVHKATHRLVPTEYTMELELGRDAFGSTGNVPDPRARRIVADRNTPTGRPKSAYPPSVLVGGQWRAQWSSARR